jgi:hypothetical protein
MTPTTRDVSDPDEPLDTYGPAGSYGCACPCRDAKDCTLLRYGFTFERPLACECMCHQWRDDDDES